MAIYSKLQLHSNIPFSIQNGFSLTESDVILIPHPGLPQLLFYMQQAFSLFLLQAKQLGDAKAHGNSTLPQRVQVVDRQSTCTMCVHMKGESYLYLLWRQQWPAP